MLACPNCNLALLVANKIATCVNGHSFDQAREGYLNLLTSGRRPTDKVAGDTPEALQARRRFLGAGHYQPISDAVIEMIGPLVGPVLDVGCGEGYYLGRIATDAAFGLDISKAAIKMAASHYRTSTVRTNTFVVGSAYRLPILTGAAGAVISIFAQRPYPEFVRVLVGDGCAVTCSPGPNHLTELTQTDDSDKRQQRALTRVEPPVAGGRAERVTYTLPLGDDASRDLVQMTPLFWQGQSRLLLEQGLGEVTVDVWVQRLSVAEMANLPIQ
jgi:23S rRNA (guanine745-N1)-methyltransferase